MILKEAKISAKVHEVSSHKAYSGVDVVLCQQAERFGVIMRRSQGVVFAPNYTTENSYLQTFEGNEADIIDWVDRAEAHRRYTKLVMSEMSRAPVTQHQLERNSRPFLFLVHG